MKILNLDYNAITQMYVLVNHPDINNMKYRRDFANIIDAEKYISTIFEQDSKFQARFSRDFPEDKKQELINFFQKHFKKLSGAALEQTLDNE
jgi:hypothetical protein